MMDGKKLNRMCVDCTLYKQKECNGTFESVCTGCRKQQDLTGVFSYCPNCGAKMDEKED